ncbi:MAG: 50S ribosomal protein L25/general stress protein Ctc [Flammeovirgaceae bacterium]
MKIVDVIGYNRTEIGKKSSKDLRRAGNVPCVMYGGEEGNLHFHSPMILFRDLVYTPEVCFVNMDIEGKEYKCILQDVQFHPVSEIILHADFLRLYDDVPVMMEIPVKFVGNSPGLQKGGKLSTKLRKIKVKALPKDMPENVEVSLEGLELGQSVKVKSVDAQNYEILSGPNVTIASVTIPRALRSAQAKGEGEE